MCFTCKKVLKLTIFGAKIQIIFFSKANREADCTICEAGIQSIVDILKGLQPRIEASVTEDLCESKSLEQCNVIVTVLTQEILDFEGLTGSCGFSSPINSDDVYCDRPAGECFVDVFLNFFEDVEVKSMIADKLKSEMSWDMAKAETVVQDAINALFYAIFKNEIEVCPENRRK